MTMTRDYNDPKFWTDLEEGMHLVAKMLGKCADPDLRAPLLAEVTRIIMDFSAAMMSASRASREVCEADSTEDGGEDFSDPDEPEAATRRSPCRLVVTATPETLKHVEELLQKPPDKPQVPMMPICLGPGEEKSR